MCINGPMKKRRKQKNKKNVRFGHCYTHIIENFDAGIGRDNPIVNNTKIN